MDGNDFLGCKVYVLSELENSDLKFKLYEFENAAMIDIWVHGDFWVVQIEEEFVGLSLVTEDEGIFDIIPDKIFYDFDSFKEEFDKIGIKKN